jgi:hypothetical protein
MEGDRAYTYLTSKGNRRLIQSFLLRVPDVRRDNFIEREPIVLLLQLLAKKLCLDRELATNSILDLFKSRVQ